MTRRDDFGVVGTYTQAMQFRGTLSNGRSRYEGVVGILDESGASGRFMLKAAERLSGPYILTIASRNLSLRVFSSTGNLDQPLYYEFQVAGASG